MIIMINKMDIMNVGLRAGIRSISNYVLSDIIVMGDNYVTFIADPKTRKRIPIVWSKGELDKQETEKELIRFCSTMAKNAVDSLRFLIEEEHLI